MLTTNYYDDYRGTGADKLKFALMPFVCFACFGCPTQYGSYIKVLSGFVAPAFFILCGFFMFGRNSEERLDNIKRGIKRSAAMFIPMFIVFLAINAVYYYFVNGINVFPTLLGKRKLFEIFVLSYWPFDMGASIWFIQDLLYVYIFLFLLEKIKLFKLYKVIMVLLLLATPFVGEFAKAVHFRFLGYNYIPIGFFTCALPFVLLGAFLREKFKRVLRTSTGLFYFFAIAGFIAAFAEMELLAKHNLLAYTGQSIGLNLAAVGLCCIAFLNAESRENFFSKHGASYAKRIYILSQPVAFALLVPAQFFSLKFLLIVRDAGAIIVYPVCLLIAYIIGRIKANVLRKKRLKERLHAVSPKKTEE